MKNLRSAIMLLAVTALLLSCDRSEDDPYIIFKDSSGNVISSSGNIPVELNSTVRIYAEIGYRRSDGNNLDYDWKTGSGEFTPYSASDGLDITTIGSYNNLNTEKATFDITFGGEIVSSGTVVTIRVRDQGTLSRSLSFLVE